ncbi:hypothetical protein MXD61_22605 [Frankia sp. AgPm24]|uniref:hypothetical protein n=1 Tax=Frankia sp. AgPm24 TaxID=631128 RepID=UPI0020102C39|nr:hypothetical protein [Frankia sp. AgPm24]MCK9924620.1 hypothetical protein [Frankia sp. AgPm24]
MTKATAETSADSGATVSRPAGEGPAPNPPAAEEPAADRDAPHADDDVEWEVDPALEPVDELPDARALWIIAFTFAALGLFFPLAGLIAIGCGALAWRRGSGRGRIATFVALGTTLVGILLMVVVLLR